MQKGMGQQEAKGGVIMKAAYLCILYICAVVYYLHRWALSPISVISDIGLSLISELPISD
jgi:hypothetical protein